MPILVALFFSFFFSGCALFNKEYSQPAYHPEHPEKVVVKVSLKKQMVYVMEGKKPLLVTAGCVGRADHPTPQGSFKVERKERHKRSNSYGFSRKGGVLTPAGINQVQGGEYIGYPMPYWVEFSPGYGFHQGWVWPVPRSHGCIRLHANDAGKFFELVQIGTPILIAPEQEEDKTLGKDFSRPRDYRKSDPPNEFLVSPHYFESLKPIQFQ